MTQDEIIRMAREAGCHASVITGAICFNPDVLERFAALVAAHEREVCAKVCEEEAASWARLNAQDEEGYSAIQCAAAIRARGESRGSDE